jgi:hypothetical protein
MNALDISGQVAVLLISLAAVLTLGCANLHLRRPKESRLVLELKRRRRLMTQLRRVVDNEEDASRLLRIEATRLKDTARSERVLISAIARANRGPDHWQCLWEDIV